MRTLDTLVRLYRYPDGIELRLNATRLRKKTRQGTGESSLNLFVFSLALNVTQPFRSRCRDSVRNVDFLLSIVRKM